MVAAKFKAEFEIVLIQLPPEIVDELNVLVDAVARIGGVGAGLGEEARPAAGSDGDENDRKTRIRRARAGARRAEARPAGSVAGGAESNRARMKTLVLGEETLGEAVPAEAHFVQLRRGKDVDVGERNQLHACRSHRVESGKLASRGVEGQGKRLRAVAEEIPARKRIVLADRLIDLRNHAGQAVRGRRNRGSVRPVGAAGVIGRIRSLRRGDRVVGRGPRVSRQERGND